MFTCTGYAATDASAPLAPFTFERRDPGVDDIEIKVLFCGVCHSDLHQVRDEWANTVYPCLPGHEIVGEITRVGTNVTKFKTGDLAGVGCMVDSCRECESCKEGLENYCKPGFKATYNSPDTKGDGHTFGGYSSHVVVDQHFVLRLPKNLDLAGIAPLLCAGITTYSPLRHWRVKAGEHGRDRRARRARPHGRQACPRDGHKGDLVHDLTRARPRMPRRLAPIPLWSRAIAKPWPRRPNASTSSSIRSRRNTTSTTIWVC